jgi:hypothetical protein
MKNTNLIIGILLVVILVSSGIFIYSNSKKNPNQINPINQECSNQGSYCIYNNIPSYLKYTSPNEDIPENFIADRQEVLNKYFKRITSEGQQLNEAFGLDANKYACLNGDKILIVNYFYDLCIGFEGMEGCGYSRKAIVCGGNMYFIEQYSDTTGPVMYGPFSIPQFD